MSRDGFAFVVDFEADIARLEGEQRLRDGIRCHCTGSVDGNGLLLEKLLLKVGWRIMELLWKCGVVVQSSFGTTNGC